MSQFSTPEDLENIYVRDVYDQIAPHFSHSKYKAWPKVEQFLCSFPAGSLIADIGCGTGRYLGLSDNTFILGAERSKRFAEIARDRKHEIVVCDNIALPYRANSLDGIISVGVIHHFASAKRRLTALREMARVLVPGGKLLVCVWALEQSERKFNGTDVLVPYRRTKGKKGILRKRTNVNQHPGFRKYTGQQCSEGDDTRILDNDDYLIEDNEKCSQALNPNLMTDDLPEVRKETKLPRLFSSLENHALFNNVFKMLKEGLVTNSDNSGDKNTKKGGLVPLVIARFFEKRRNSQENDSDTESGDNRLSNSSTSNLHMHTKLNACEGKAVASRKSSTPVPCQNRTQVQTRAIPKYSSSLDGEIPTRDHDSRHHKIGNSWLSSPNVTDYNKDYCAPDGPKASGRVWDESEKNSPRLGLNLLVRLMETISSSSSDTDSDSSLSSDYINSDSGLSDTDQSELILPAVCSKSFTHSTVCCHATPGCSNTFVMVNPTQSENGEPTHLEKLQRYYHVFRKGELVQLIEKGVPSLQVVREYYDHGNWAVIAEKRT